MKIASFELDDSLITLLGFAKKSRQMVSGFEGVRRSLGKSSLVFIIIDEGLTEGTRQKILNAAQKIAMPVFVAKSMTPEKSLWQVTGYKIIGLYRGGLADGFLSKIKQEN